jgi:tetratricopeptide (TPR) repeat protein
MLPPSHAPSQAGSPNELDSAAAASGQGSRRSSLSITSAAQPTTAKAWHDLGYNETKRQNGPAAITAFTEALNLDPNYVRALLNRGALYYAAGQYDAAIADYDRVINLRPEAATYLKRGDAKRKRNKPATDLIDGLSDLESAYADYRQARALDPKLMPEIEKTTTRLANSYVQFTQNPPQDIKAWENAMEKYSSALGVASLLERSTTSVDNNLPSAAAGAVDATPAAKATRPPMTATLASVRTKRAELAGTPAQKIAASHAGKMQRDAEILAEKYITEADRLAQEQSQYEAANELYTKALSHLAPISPLCIEVRLKRAQTAESCHQHLLNIADETSQQRAESFRQQAIGDYQTLKSLSEPRKLAGGEIEPPILRLKPEAQEQLNTCLAPFAAPFIAQGDAQRGATEYPKAIKSYTAALDYLPLASPMGIDIQLKRARTTEDYAKKAFNSHQYDAALNIQQQAINYYEELESLVASQPHEQAFAAPPSRHNDSSAAAAMPPSSAGNAAVEAKEESGSAAPSSFALQPAPIIQKTIQQIRQGLKNAQQCLQRIAREKTAAEAAAQKTSCVLM